MDNCLELVSIVVTSCNQRLPLLHTVESILAQSYSNIELIVVDRASTDGTPDELKRIRDADPRLRYYSYPNIGTAQAYNLALDKAKGTIIGWMPPGTVYTLAAIERAISAVSAEADLLMVYGRGETQDASGAKIEFVPAFPAKQATNANSAGNFLCPPAVFFKWCLLSLIGKFDQSLESQCDFDFWVRAFYRLRQRIGFVNAIQTITAVYPGRYTTENCAALVIQSMCIVFKYYGDCSAEWARGYIEAIWAQKVDQLDSSGLKDLCATFLERVAPFLSVADYERLYETVEQKTALYRVNRRSAQENAKLALEEFKAGVVKVNSMPNMLTLETSSRCNLQCVMCPHGINGVDRPKHLSNELMDKLLPYVRNSTMIQLHGIGEPLFSPSFWHLLQYLPSTASCDSSVNTNLVLLDQAKTDQIIKSNIKIVNVSLDAATEVTYTRIRGGDFAKVVKNIENLIAERNRKSRTYPLVYLNMTLMRSNIEELNELVRLAARLAVNKLLFWHLNRWTETEMARYVVNKGDWVFDYAKEGLWNYPELSNRCIAEALALAKELNVGVYLDQNKQVYFDDL